MYILRNDSESDEYGNICQLVELKGFCLDRGSTSYDLYISGIHIRRYRSEEAAYNEIRGIVEALKRGDIVYQLKETDFIPFGVSMRQNW